MQKLLLIDGNAMIHRAYHALPPLTNLQGQPVQAVYGFFSMLLNVLQDQKPTHLVVCFDRGKPTIRQTMFAGYHAHRPKLSDDFVPQIVLIHELLEKMKVAIFELDGYEGDDLIGTIASRAIFSDVGPASFHPHPTASLTSFTPGARRGAPTRVTHSLAEDREVIILTGDRDMLQLVNPQVKVLMPLVGISKTVLFDEKAVEEKYGVHPRQFIDYKALIGDPSDGYSGVTGIGPKTAASLLQKYETFENLYHHVGELQEKVGLKLATDAEQAALAKKLATIITDVPIQFAINNCACSDFDTKSLLEGFKRQGFKSLTVRFESVFGSEQNDEQLGLL
ncbi:MAG TPA: 5'-3' exonuclease H3TH domain-containing protein [Methylomirabilota bacterium]|nr:5'-3' exonuclease H3TH domain-containing protein [Methylomirabilota bacterium]